MRIEASVLLRDRDEEVEIRCIKTSLASPIKTPSLRGSIDFRDEVLDAHLFKTLSEAQEAAEIWSEDYNEYRPHESLGRLPPAIFKPRVCKPETSTSGL